jgi:hypothetical protein
MALGALIFELYSPVLLIRGRLRQYDGGVAVLFHLGSLVLLRMDFLGMALICAAVVIDLEGIPEFVARFVRVSLQPLRRTMRVPAGEVENIAGASTRSRKRARRTSS